MVDVRDESTDEVRIVVVLKVPSGSSPEREMNLAMAYLCKHTQLQITLSITWPVWYQQRIRNCSSYKGNIKRVAKSLAKSRFSTIENAFSMNY